MIDRSSLALDALIENYTLANTPAFLLSRFRTDPQVLMLADRTPGELVDMIYDVVRTPERTIADVVAAYAGLVALVIQGTTATALLGADESLLALEWLRPVVALGAVRASGTTTMLITVPAPPPLVATAAAPRASTVTQLIILDQQ